MAYQYKNDMSNNYNELMPEVDGFNTVSTPITNAPSFDMFGGIQDSMDWQGLNQYEGMNTGVNSTLNYSARSPISGSLSTDVTPNHSMGIGNYTAPMGEAMNHLGGQFKEGNIMGGLNDIMGYGADRIADTAIGQSVNRAAQTGQELWGGLDAAGKFGTIFSGLETLGGLYKGFKGMQMAKDQMAMQKDMWNKSWDANKKQFNESVASRAQGRHNGYNDQQKRDDYNKKYSI